ncbi:hypothetical protein [Luteimonas huabeiensis]|uniref:hypothetical protein n=1 Tax=Luteimonas huabeiensis TaxID=1244513 RepID=UPI00046304C5|nr:hypothetical protein [Luteimonas huabeiensis]
MFTSAELIAALHRRHPRSIRPQAPVGAFPPGWQAWFDALPARPGRVVGAPAAEIVARLAAREPAPPPPGEVPADRWRAFASLWRQQWEPARRDERSLRAVSSVGSGALHLLFLLALAWLMVVPPYRAPTQAGPDAAVEVTWIGEGTPEDAGGGAPSGEAAAEPEAEPAPATPPPAVPPAPAPATVSQPPEPEPVAAPEPVAPVQPEQPLAVTETPVPDGPFVVPPPEIPLAAPAPETREVRPRLREIAERPPPVLVRPASPSLQPRPVAPVVPQPAVELAEREIVSPPREVTLPEVSVPVPRAPVVQRDAPPARVREIPVRQPERDAGAAPAAVADAGAPASSTVEPGAAAPAPAAAEGAGPAATAAGAGPAPAAPPGAAPTPRAADDWGEAARNRPGGQAGRSALFNRDGRPQLPPEAGARVGGGLPPGTITEDYEKIDRMGTWLKRPPSDYEPTSLDPFWVPHESLLEEWARRSIRTVLIPIPGTSKSIRCDVMMLAFAGGCVITDPNKQDVEAEARPPPDVPWKPELQEDDGD